MVFVLVEEGVYVEGVLLLKLLRPVVLFLLVAEVFLRVLVIILLIDGLILNKSVSVEFSALARLSRLLLWLLFN